MRSKANSSIQSIILQHRWQRLVCFVLILSLLVSLPASSFAQSTSSGATPLVWSPDGNNLAVGLPNGTVRVWNKRAETYIATLRDLDEAVTNIAWSPDESTLAASTASGTVQIWDTETWDRLATLEGPENNDDSASEPEDDEVASADTGSDSATATLENLPTMEPTVAATTAPTDSPTAEPTVAPSTTAPTVAPTTPPDLCTTIPAPTGDDELIIRFINSSDRPVSYFWRDFDGNVDTTIGLTLAPNEYADQGTYSTHEWVILDVGDQRIGTVVAGNGPTQCERIGEKAASGDTEQSDSASSGQSDAASSSQSAAASTGGSPSGHIAFPSFEDGNWFIYVMNADGSNLQKVRGSASQPELSPDGQRIAFRNWESNNRSVSVMDVSGGNVKRLSDFLEDMLPSWSPDGQNIVFFSRRNGDRKSRIHQASVENGNEWNLGDVRGEYPTWLPSGRIAYRATSPQISLSVMNNDGSNITSAVADGDATAPAISPDGKTLLYMTKRDGNWESYSITNDGSDPTRITNNPANDGLPAWSPDGQTIAFASDRSGTWAIWLMNADGSNQRELLTIPGTLDGYINNEPDYSARGWVEERISWTGGGVASTSSSTNPW